MTNPMDWLKQVFSGQAGGVGPREAEQLIARGVAVIDVREASEVAGGMIAQAKHVPLGDVDAYGWNALKNAGIAADTRELVVVCRSGMRSQRAIARLRSERSDVTLINLDGGMIAWCNEGLPTRPG